MRYTGSFLCALLLSAVGCRAQQPPASSSAQLPAETARRVEIALRARLNIPPTYDIVVGSRTQADIPNFDQVKVTLINEDGKAQSVEMLLSKDGKTLAQFAQFDISKDPRTFVSDKGRPTRGGGDDAPVHIVVFDDLECPFCARMHQELFPALLQRYGDKVRIVYKDFPLSQHPWAVHAAMAANCLAGENPEAYWKFVDQVHTHPNDVFTPKEESDKAGLARATDQLDLWARDQAKAYKVDTTRLDVCLAKKDEAPINASMKEGEALGVESTPDLFINGEKLAGAVPLKYVYKMIDGALVAAGVTPPPPYVEPDSPKAAGN